MTAACPVVYFGAVPGPPFGAGDLVVLVHSKNPGHADMPVWYCLGVTPLRFDASFRCRRLLLHLDVGFAATELLLSRY